MHSRSSSQSCGQLHPVRQKLLRGSKAATMLHSLQALLRTSAAVAHMQSARDPSCLSELKQHEVALTVLDAVLKPLQVYIEPLLPLRRLVKLVVHHVALPQPAQPRRRQCLQIWQRAPEGAPSVASKLCTLHRSLQLMPWAQPAKGSCACSSGRWVPEG